MPTPDRNCELKKKSQLFIQFPFICFNNLKYVEQGNIFYLKYKFCCPLDPAAWGG
jgi:hypothetical protein